MKLGPKQTPGKVGDDDGDTPRPPDFITIPASTENHTESETDRLKAMVKVALDEDIRPNEAEKKPNPVSGERLNLDDYKSLPLNSTELHDPFKTAILMQLKMCLLRISASEFPIDADGKKAIALIKERLEYLGSDCAKNEMQDWVPIIGRHLRIINAILERKN